MRVMVVTDTAFLPRTQGDSARIARVIELFQVFGWTVDVAHFHDPKQPFADYEGMRNACRRLNVYFASDAELRRRSGERIDDWCLDGFVSFVHRLIEDDRPDAIWVQFVYNTKLLLGLPSGSPLKIVDADNILANRRAPVEAQGIPYEWFSTTPAEEVKGLRRADVIVAIQRHEAEHFRKLDPSFHIELLPHMPELRLLPPAEGNAIVFVGADNPENRAGLLGFLEYAWPRIREAVPSATLDIVGRICSMMEGDYPGVCFRGVMADLSRAYADMVLALNTTALGTGLKIKSVDALTHGRPLISTSAGLQGLEHLHGCYCRADSHEAFVEAIVGLLRDKRRLRAMTCILQDVVAQEFDALKSFAPFEARLRGRLQARSAEPG